MLWPANPSIFAIWNPESVQTLALIHHRPPSAGRPDHIRPRLRKLLPRAEHRGDGRIECHCAERELRLACICTNSPTDAARGACDSHKGNHFIPYNLLKGS